MAFDWNAFYSGIPTRLGTGFEPAVPFGTPDASVINRAYTSDPIGTMPTWDDLTKAFPRTGPGGLTDILETLFGPRDRTRTDEALRELIPGQLKEFQENGGATGDETFDLTGVTDWIGGTFGRIGIIVLGIVFVAVGLSMFKNRA